ncbi:unnamed protein product [Urochloa humidicola]
MSRHRRQPSRALPLDFNVVDDDEGPAGARKGGVTSLDGSQNPGAGGGGGGRRDAGGAAGKGQEGHSNKPPPPATGSRSSEEGPGKKSLADNATGGR